MKTRIDDVRKLIQSLYVDSRAKSLALTKLDECEMWLERAVRTDDVSS